VKNIYSNFLCTSSFAAVDDGGDLIVMVIMMTMTMILGLLMIRKKLAD